MGRSNKLPGIPTWADLGVTGPAFEHLVELNIFLAPAETSPAIVERIAQITHEAVAKSERVKGVRDKAGASDTPVSGSVLQKVVSESRPTYRKMTQALGLTAA